MTWWDAFLGRDPVHAWREQGKVQVPSDLAERLVDADIVIDAMLRSPLAIWDFGHLPDPLPPALAERRERGERTLTVVIERIEDVDAFVCHPVGIDNVTLVIHASRLLLEGAEL